MVLGIEMARQRKKQPEAVAGLSPQDRAVLALSVYNALSLTGRDMTIDECAMFLAVHWSPSISPNAERVSSPVVASSAEYLRQLGYVTIEHDRLGIAVRDPGTRRGRALNIDYKAGAVVPDNGSF